MYIDMSSRKRGNGTKEIFEKIMVKIFPDLMKTIYL
jgi:hypothetical protein